MANRNSVSLEDKLLIWSQYKISPLQFFCNVSLLNCNSCCWFIYLCICFQSVFGCFPFHITGGEGGVFLPFFTFHILWNSTLSFSPSDMEKGTSERTVSFKSKNGWGGCNIELVNTSRDLSTGYGTRFPFSPLLLLPLSAPGVSLCSQNNAWVMSALRRRCSVQRFSTNAPHNDHVLLPLSTSSIDCTL